MRFIFMVFHYPAQDHRDELINGMREMADFFHGKPGFIEAGAWVEDRCNRVTGISIWEYRQAFFATGITFDGADAVPAGETKPRERFFLERA